MVDKWIILIILFIGLFFIVGGRVAFFLILAPFLIAKEKIMEDK